MKIAKYNIIAFLMLLVTMGFSSCEDADPEFIHTDNFISAMTCSSGRTNASPTINGVIQEYDKAGNLLPPDFTSEQAEGGSGVIIFYVAPDEREDFDLTRVYLRATLTWDESVYPTLSGLHNILVDDEHPDGKVFAVKSGVNTVRKYRIMGIYE